MLWLALLVSVVLLGLSALLCASETAVLMLPAGRVHRLLEAERAGAQALDSLAEARHRLRAVATLIGGAAFASAAVAGASVGVAIGDGAAAGDSVWLAALASTSAASLGGILFVLVTYSLTQALPRTIAVTNPERVALETARLTLPLTRAIYPVARVLGSPWKWLVDVVGAERTLTPWAVTPEWRGSASDEDAVREEAEEALLEAVSDFAEKVAREVMVPRTDMRALPDTATVEEAVALIAATGYSRLPVYHQTIDDVRGVLYAKDLLGALAGCETGAPVSPLAREPYFVPETKPVEELMVEMRERTHIAIVADEYGGTAGLVTLEDLLEEIVGEIADEYDREEPLVVALEEGRYRVDARLPVGDLDELLGTDIDTETDSVGGLFTEVAGHIPKRGESVVIEGVRLTVTQLEGARIRQLVVEPAGPSSEGEHDA